MSRAEGETKGYLYLVGPQKLHHQQRPAFTATMPPPPSKKPSANKIPKKQPPRTDKKKSSNPNTQAQNNANNAPSASPLDNSTIPLTLQQLLLNVFQSALLPNVLPSSSTAQDANADTDTEPSVGKLDLKPLIQTIKSHLYNRDFDAAFTDANDELLRAYALRWSATRALGYASVFKAVLKLLFEDSGSSSSGHIDDGEEGQERGQVVCVGGGAGAEIVALAAAWRDLSTVVSSVQEEGEGKNMPMDLTVTAVDIADWSSVVGRLDTTMRESRVSSFKSHPAPLLQCPGDAAGRVTVDFHRADILSISDTQLRNLYNSSQRKTTMVTLMFTLNELFSTSIAKATSFLLRTSDAVQPGTLLLVVDSPGSYSSLTLNRGAPGTTSSNGGNSEGSERRYPMKFLLDHTLLSVAEGRWERVVSEDSRWWRRDVNRLFYEVGEGGGLEDMRFQVHLYRRV